MDTPGDYMEAPTKTKQHCLQHLAAGDFRSSCCKKAKSETPSLILDARRLLDASRRQLDASRKSDANRACKLDANNPLQPDVSQMGAGCNVHAIWMGGAYESWMLGECKLEASEMQPG